MRALRKTAIVLLVLAGLSWLFLKTLRDSNSAPYVIRQAELSPWTLVVEDPDLGGPAFLGLQPPAQLVGNVFGQIFTRTGQSLASPLRPSMPIVLAGEYASALKGVLSPDELMQAARAAGLESEPVAPVCLAMHKDQQSARSGQRFFLVFESRAFTRLRDELARLHKTRSGPGAFDAAALRPILPIASTEPDFERWRWPVAIDTAVDCLAPLEAS